MQIKRLFYNVFMMLCGFRSLSDSENHFWDSWEHLREIILFATGTKFREQV